MKSLIMIAALVCVVIYILANPGGGSPSNVAANSRWNLDDGTTWFVRINGGDVQFRAEVQNEEKTYVTVMGGGSMSSWSEEDTDERVLAMMESEDFEKIRMLRPTHPHRFLSIQDCTHEDVEVDSGSLDDALAAGECDGDSCTLGSGDDAFTVEFDADGMPTHFDDWEVTVENDPDMGDRVGDDGNFVRCDARAARELLEHVEMRVVQNAWRQSGLASDAEADLIDTADWANPWSEDAHEKRRKMCSLGNLGACLSEAVIYASGTNWCGPGIGSDCTPGSQSEYNKVRCVTWSGGGGASGAGADIQDSMCRAHDTCGGQFNSAMSGSHKLCACDQIARDGFGTQGMEPVKTIASHVFGDDSGWWCREYDSDGCSRYHRHSRWWGHYHSYGCWENESFNKYTYNGNWPVPSHCWAGGNALDNDSGPHSYDCYNNCPANAGTGGPHSTDGDNGYQQTRNRC